MSLIAFHQCFNNVFTAVSSSALADHFVESTRKKVRFHDGVHNMQNEQDT